MINKNIERHTADTIVSWPNPKQWVIVHTSDLMMLIRQSIYIISIITIEMGKLKTYSPDIVLWVMERICLILLTHSTKYIWQAFYEFNTFRYVCTMMIMRCVLYKQTSTICKPKQIRIVALIINCTKMMKTNSRFSRNLYAISDRIWCNKHLRHTTTEKYDNNGKGGYFRFDDDHKMSYRYILSIT